MVMFLLILFSLAIDVYIYFAALRRCGRRWAVVQAVSAVALYIFIVVTVSLPRRGGSDATLVAVMWMLFGYLTVYFGKFVFVILDLLACVPRLWRGKRIKWLSRAAAVCALIVFAALWWGALVNRFRIQVREVEVVVDNLPEAFDGLRIVQFSDLHTGTYGSDTSFVHSAVERINSLKPDIVFFTGDIVNRRSDELEPFVTPLSRLRAPLGVFSIKGNHDYGDYSDWSSVEAKDANNRRLAQLQRAMGWELLLNEHRKLRLGGDSIALIGVENIGDPPFAVYGSLARAYPTPGDSLAKILLTHNPAHWVDSIAPVDTMNIALTLSGHTHAMQMELLGWSPAEFRYPTWGGLYHSPDSTRKLYVNIGLGTVGIPMRLGATPELTLITLRRPGK